MTNTTLLPFAVVMCAAAYSILFVLRHLTGNTAWLWAAYFMHALQWVGGLLIIALAPLATGAILLILASCAVSMVIPELTALVLKRIDREDTQP